MTSRSNNRIRIGLATVFLSIILMTGAGLCTDHKVAKGETLYGIARRYGVTVEDLRKWNNLYLKEIRPGQVLRIRSDPRPDQGQSPAPATSFHTVKKGETLWRIAYLNGASVKTLMDLNGIKDVGGLKAGQRIRIPSTGTRQTADPAPRKTRGGKVPGLRIDRPVRGPCEKDRKGLRIYCSRGSSVSAVLAGQVEYIGTLVGYRNVVILSHPGNVYTVYAALDGIQVRQGQKIQPGTSIGRVDKLSHYDRPFLYFELIANGHNVDPEKHFQN